MTFCCQLHFSICIFKCHFQNTFSLSWFHLACPSVHFNLHFLNLWEAPKRPREAPGQRSSKQFQRNPRRTKPQTQVSKGQANSIIYYGISQDQIGRGAREWNNGLLGQQSFLEYVFNLAWGFGHQLRNPHQSRWSNLRGANAMAIAALPNGVGKLRFN